MIAYTIEYNTYRQSKLWIVSREVQKLDFFGITSITVTKGKTILETFKKPCGA